MPLEPREKELLLKIARNAIEERLRTHRNSEAPGCAGAAAGDCGAFVTLRRDGELRGCIGLLSSERPLYETVREMALAAAFKDPRFDPVTEDELDDLSVEISVLSPMREIDDPEEVEAGRHGVCIIDGARRGVLLPQVARENGFTREEFLSQACIKAGLDPDSWRQGARIHIFEADIITESDDGPL